MFLNNEDVRKLLPHREPLLLVDEAVIEEGCVAASVFVSPKWDVFRGHFPENPVLPGIYVTESMAQAADLLLLSEPSNTGKLPYFSSIRNMRFIRPVLPGTQLTLKAEITQDAGNGFYECAVSAEVAGRTAAKGSISLALR